MGILQSRTGSLKLTELRDLQSFPVVLYTKLGRNGVKEYRLAKPSGLPEDLTGMTLRLVVKTSEDAADTELDANFPLACTTTSAGNGEFEADFGAVEFTTTQNRVIVTVYDDAGANPVILAQATTAIRKAGA